VQGCETCAREGDRPHDTRRQGVGTADLCPEARERQRDRLRRYMASEGGRAVNRDANTRYRTTAAGFLNENRRNARRRGNRG